MITQKKIDDIFYSLPEEKRTLVIPVMPTDRQFIDGWMAQAYEKPGFKADDQSSFYTCTNVRVRSKAEMIIAQTLDSNGLFYKYEFPLVINGRKIHPDFIIISSSGDWADRRACTAICSTARRAYKVN